MYSCGCNDCKDKSTQLNLSISDSFKQLLNAGQMAFKRLHEIGSYKPQDLKNEKAYQDLISKTYDAFNFAITDNDMPNEMRTALQSDAFLFGGLKAHAQLFEASKLLLNDNGNLKPFKQLSNQFDKLNLTYNKTYLESEYEFAVSSSQMAAKWSEFSDNERYYLQYRTAGDNRVRDEHAKLNGTTLPKDDPFWSSYTPPNGWNCRCTVVEVLKDKYPLSDSEESIKAGEAATTKLDKNNNNTLEKFRFNPGKDLKLFPPDYTYGKMAGAKLVKEKILGNLEKQDYKILNDNSKFNENKGLLKDKKLDEVYPKIDIEKVNSVNMYTRSHYKNINEFNRHNTINQGETLSETETKYYKTLTKVLNKGLDEIPDKHIGLCYRGTDLTPEKYNLYKEAFKNNKTISDKGFTSTSYSKHEAFAGEHNFIINSKTGTKIEKISAHSREKEVVFKSGQKFKIINIEEEDGLSTIYMEEI